ncbi:CpsD/CapB family tyrosine-protein kinase [Niallia taxi]|nr:CpsD/CapB family tyrosine-protein kinase [Niallia taxi]MDE5053917.1 CpsD/CapB family tyrosine-protein kinase [Niallia taxi]
MSPLLKRKSEISLSSNLLSHLKPKSPIREQYHAIRASIQLAINENNIQTMVIISGEELEGKSTIAANLAITFAEVGKKVLLIDANFRQPSAHTAFEKENEVGLSTFLVENLSISECITESNIENLGLLFCGPIPLNPSELLGSRRMETLINELKESYDIVIFDTPAVSSVADSLILANICDGVLMAVRSGKNGVENVEFARDMFSNTNAFFLGAVLNDARIHKKKSKKKNK